MIELIISILIAIASITTPDGVDVYRVASRSAGEARVLGPEGVQAVACTIRERMETRQQSLDQVLLAYYAPDITPTPEEIEVSRLALAGFCDTNSIYAFSKQDVAYLGFDPSTADKVIKRDGYAIYFWEEWPGEK